MCVCICIYGLPFVAQLGRNPPVTLETWVPSMDWEDPWRRERLPTPVFQAREFHELCSPRGHKESDTTERLSLSYVFIYTHIYIHIYICCSVAQSCLTLCDPHGLQYSRLACLSSSPRACSNSYPLSSVVPFFSCLLPSVFHAHLCPTLCDPMDHSSPGFLVHRIFLGKNTGVGCSPSSRGFFLTQGSNLHLLCFLHQQVDSLPLSHLGYKMFNFTLKTLLITLVLERQR